MSESSIRQRPGIVTLFPVEIGRKVHMSDKEYSRYWRWRKERDEQSNAPSSTAADFWSWMLFLLVVGGLLVFVFLAVFAFPLRPWGWRPPGPPPPPPVLRQDGLGGRSRDQCTTDEVYDEESQQCMMVSHFPSAVAPALIDHSVSPCDDFYRHACGKWIAEHTDENRGFTGLANLNAAKTRAIVLDENVPELHNFFQSCEATLVENATDAAKPAWDRAAAHTAATREAILTRLLDSLVTHSDLPVVLARLGALGYTTPVSLTIQGSPVSKGLVPMFAYDGFDGLERDLDWVVMHFELLHKERAHEDAEKLVKFVTQLNLARPDPTGAMDTREGWKKYVSGNDVKRDIMPWSEFSAGLSVSKFDWHLYVRTLEKELDLAPGSLQFAAQQPVWAFSRAYFEWWHPEQFSVEDWRLYVKWTVLYHTHQFFPELPSDVFFRKAAAPVSREFLRHRWRKTRLYEKPEERARRRREVQMRREHRHSRYVAEDSASRWTFPEAVDHSDEGLKVSREDCIRAAKYMLPGIVSKEFLARNFQRGEEIRARVKGVVERIRDAFVANILKTPWMDEATRRAQAEKIRAIVPRVVHPSSWSEEVFAAGSRMDPDKYLRNLNIIQAERVRRNLAMWSESNFGAKCGPSCRDRITAFGAPLSIVNAWYNPDRNVITVPAGILQPPFFHERYDDASVYATIGMVVAHELSHAEDPHGSLFDKDGLMNDTWSKEARVRYRERAMCVVKEYGSPEGCTNDHYGEQTLCEDTADLNGVHMASEACPAKTVEDKKNFYYAFGQMWCSSYTLANLCSRVNDDVHAVASFRVRKTLAHTPDFAETFGCPVGSPMHRHPTERCVFFGDK